MKIQKIKKLLETNTYILIISFFFVGNVFGAYTSYIISPQTSIQFGSYDSSISFTGSLGREGYYVNDKDNSSIIGNYFKGYYYDNLFGFFKLDWSSNMTDNVRIVGSTAMCLNGYGYKLGGMAYSENSGFIDFDYNENTFVYYCLSDQSLHGTAYGKYIGYQSFDGIEIDILADFPSLVEKTNSNLFKNDTTDIEKSTTLSLDERKSLGGDFIQVDDTKESIFYIIK